MIKWGVRRGGGASRVRSGWDDKNIGSLAVEFVLLQFGLEEGFLCLGLFGTPGIAAGGLGAAFLLFDALHESDGPFDFELNQIVQLEVGQEEVVEERFHVDGLVGEDKGIHQSILCLVQGRFGDVFSNFHTAHLNIILSVLLQNIYTTFRITHFSLTSLQSLSLPPPAGPIVASNSMASVFFGITLQYQSFFAAICVSFEIFDFFFPQPLTFAPYHSHFPCFRIISSDSYIISISRKFLTQVTVQL